MDIADRNGVDLSLVLRSTDRFSERAISLGLRRKTLASRSMALLCLVTYADQRRPAVRFPLAACRPMAPSGPARRACAGPRPASPGWRAPAWTPPGAARAFPRPRHAPPPCAQ